MLCEKNWFEQLNKPIRSTRRYVHVRTNEPASTSEALRCIAVVGDASAKANVDVLNFETN